MRTTSENHPHIKIRQPPYELLQQKAVKTKNPEVAGPRGAKDSDYFRGRLAAWYFCGSPDVAKGSFLLLVMGFQKDGEWEPSASLLTAPPQQSQNFEIANPVERACELNGTRFVLERHSSPEGVNGTLFPRGWTRNCSDIACLGYSPQAGGKILVFAESVNRNLNIFQGFQIIENPTKIGNSRRQFSQP